MFKKYEIICLKVLSHMFKMNEVICLKSMQSYI